MKLTIHKKYFTAVTVLLLFSAFANTVKAQGFVQTDVIKVSGITTDAQIYGLTASSRQVSRAYYDGFGRVIQTIAVQASPSQKDIIQPAVYDNLGRQLKSYLPYTDNGSAQNGSYRASALADQASFYAGSDPTIPIDSAYSRSIIEQSPLQRMLKTGMAGNGFQPASGQHYKTVNYRTNVTGDGNIIIWNPDGSNSGSHYSAGGLSVVDGTDEMGHEALSFTDIAGRLILKRQINNSVNIDTYYIYNNGGQIAYIVPPKATSLIVASGYALTQTTVANLIFQYTYDSMGRLAIKRMPGQIDSYIIYDPLNRPVLSQDAHQRLKHQWAYVKYDVKGRAISTGIYTDTDTSRLTQTGMQHHVTTDLASAYNTAWYESRSSSASTTGYYTNSIFPSSNTDPLTYSYYDDYDRNMDGTPDYSYASTGLSGEASQTTAPITGMPTMTAKRTIGAGMGNIWLLTVVFYDHYGHAIQTRSNNHINYTNISTLTDTATVVPDFMGRAKITKVVKYTGTRLAVTSTPVYDHVGRLKTIDQTYVYGGATKTLRVASYVYNALGQLVQKKLDSLGSNSTLQNIDFRYNIRGQLLSINNSKLAPDGGTTNLDTNDLFGMKILYDKQDTLGNIPDYSGKISGVKWMSKDASGSSSYERAYTYTYDSLSRLRAANYAERTTTSTGSFGNNIGGFDEKMSYDVQGNIQTMKRNYSTQGTNSHTQGDNLTYSYNSSNPNRLDSVRDASADSFGFNRYGHSGSYAYDANCNMTSDPYKGMTMSYNVLNKTDTLKITAGTNQRIIYTYDATGTLLRKDQYNNVGSLVKTTDYLDVAEYEGGALNYLRMPEGRVLYIPGSNILTPEYVIGDNQGNARISFQDNGSGTAVVKQENSYYAFGLTMPNSPVSAPTIPNKLLYNGGSEWQNDYGNLPDLQLTFYRNYDAALGRFIGVDPMPESAESMTVYQYAGNNPVMMNDPLGNLIKGAPAGVIPAAESNPPVCYNSGRVDGPWDSEGRLKAWEALMEDPEYWAFEDALAGGGDPVQHAAAVEARRQASLGTGETNYAKAAASFADVQPELSEIPTTHYELAGLAFFNADHSNHYDKNGANWGNAYYLWYLAKGPDSDLDTKVQELFVKVSGMMGSDMPEAGGIGDLSFRSPDFYSINVSVALENPYTYGLIGWNGNVTIDRNMNVHVSPYGFTIGKSALGISGSISGNWLMQSTEPTQKQLDNFLLGNSINIGGGDMLGGSLTNSPGNGWAWGVGLYSPQEGVSYNYQPPGSYHNLPGPTTSDKHYQ